MHLAGEQLAPRLDRTPKQPCLAGLDRVVGERSRPEIGGPLDPVRLELEPTLCVRGDLDALGVVDRLQVAPGERANGRGAVISDEEHGGVAGRVVEVDDGADVVAVEGSHSAIGQEVVAGVSETVTNRGRASLDERPAAPWTWHRDAETGDSSGGGRWDSAAERCRSNRRNPNLPRFVTVSFSYACKKIGLLSWSYSNAHNNTYVKSF